MPQRSIKICAVFLFLFLGAPPALALVNLHTVTVMADNSMSMAMVEIARNYSRDHNIIVNTSFAAPAAQEEQITEGGAADILITPKQLWIDQLKERGLIDIYSQAPVARNRLALVGPASSTMQADLSKPFPVADLINHMGGEPDFVVASPETLIEGTYSKEALRKLGAAADLEPYTLYVKSLDDMFDMVTRNQAYGIFLYSTTLAHSGLRVLDLLPESSHQPIHYFAVVIAGDNMDEARKFIEYLKTPDARRIFRENGFNTD